ncbi:MAG: DUF1566 domain-containing protein [Candidatus Scalindua sp.]|nr:DUF1566 domain-containing protein [Candidatus Scalindua sp.]
MVFMRFCRANISLILLSLFLSCTVSFGYPGVLTASATADMPDSNEEESSPDPRFTDNGNGTVTDNRTGLIWLQNANVAGLRTWADALADVVSLNRNGTMNGTFNGDKHRMEVTRKTGACRTRMSWKA